MGLSLQGEAVILASPLPPGGLAAAEPPSTGVPSCTEGFVLLWSTRVSLRFSRRDWSRCCLPGRRCHWLSLGHLEKGGTRWANQTKAMLLATCGLQFGAGGPLSSPEPLNQLASTWEQDVQIGGVQQVALVLW